MAPQLGSKDRPEIDKHRTDEISRKLASDVEALTSELSARLQELCRRAVLDVELEAVAAVRTFLTGPPIKGDACPSPRTDDASDPKAGAAEGPDTVVMVPEPSNASGKRSRIIREKSVKAKQEAQKIDKDTEVAIAEDPSKLAATRAKVEKRQHNPHFLRRVSSLSIFATEPRSVRDVVKSLEFETAFGMLILLNCLILGLQAHDQVTDSFGPHFQTAVKAFDHIFTALFTVELLLRMWVLGRAGYWPPRTAEVRSNLFDMALVVFTGIVFTWLIPLLALIFKFDMGDVALRMLTALRVARLGRLVRVLHRVPLFREAWMLVRGLGASSRTLLWTVVVIVMVTYVFAIFGLQVIVAQLLVIKDRMEAEEEDTWKIESFLEELQGLDRMMFTLVQLLTLDEFAILTRKSIYFIWWTWAYWYIYVAVAVFVLMNLVTAIIVENAFSTSNNDLAHALAEKEAQKESLVAELQHFFELLDADGGGTLSWEEFRVSFEDSDLKDKWTLLDFQPEECKELFHLLDDGDGEIATTEFFDGLSKMKGQAQAKDVFRLQKSVHKLNDLMEALAFGMGETRTSKTTRMISAQNSKRISHHSMAGAAPGQLGA